MANDRETSLRKYLIAFLLCVIGIASHSEQTSFATPDDAVKPALTISRLNSKTYEYGGIIYRYQFGKRVYYYSQPRTNKEIDQVTIHFDDLPQGAVLAGIYHTHPCTPGYIPERFSHQDVYLMTIKRVPMYVLNMCNNEIRKLDYIEYIKYIHGTQLK